MTDYINLNAELNVWGPNGELQLDKDFEAAREYFLQEVNQNMVFFHSLAEKFDYLTEKGLWDAGTILRYGFDGFKDLMEYAYSKKFRFKTFLGAYKFYLGYALRTPDGKRWYERFEDRVVLNAITYSSDFNHARRIIDLITEGRFQPATPTFLNAGLANSGEPVSCFQLRVDDNMESIGRSITDALQLSKRGGGVGLGITSIREAGAPIKGREGQASGVVPVMKQYEDAFSYANQLGARQGAGVVYLNAHHPDILTFLDTKRENADEKIRIKTLSLGVVIPDITFELAKSGADTDMYLFSPYDIQNEYGVSMADISITEMYHELVENPRIKKTKINARKFFSALAEVQFESGYPYIMFEDAVNRANPAPNVGRISQSNLCSEIFQPQSPSTFNADTSFAEVGRDVSCNLGSLNIAKMRELKGQDFSDAVGDAYLFLHNVSKRTNIESSPTVIRGNQESRAIGLGQMNLHGWLLEQGVEYDSEEAREMFDAYMHDVTFSIIEASQLEAKRSGEYVGFREGRWPEIIGGHWGYARENFERLKRGGSIFMNHNDVEDLDMIWEDLHYQVQEFGLANQHLQAIPPTGSISYINHATASIHPITSPIEIRKEGKVGRVYYPHYGVTPDNVRDIRDAYDLGYEAVIDMYAVAGRWVDQGMSLTLFFKDGATTRDINRAQIRAHRAGLKSIYYIRYQQMGLEGTSVKECVSCML